ncbi:hypothetical protein SAMD00019534_033670 [Acytostelium subglobosum LB1]|uniref:hypothetical protein n=1 Tax=Acytostelium subglobosum LB1 TaxID=1410327 RepID=UPI0006449688|nr:hypothetical protein SAMD00019534_033670 [Acytostelium subglobosum LB1]GAM20192.1 hypothetical protein SAMD00019534_033670 [Acytostelium subglobosum LB1]|eukprot:XP_012759713.1 hypothetical protein SAMD00019534_033670 [Acytostelium subglobosum LB1]
MPCGVHDKCIRRRYHRASRYAHRLLVDNHIGLFKYLINDQHQQRFLMFNVVVPSRIAFLIVTKIREWPLIDKIIDHHSKLITAVHLMEAACSANSLDHIIYFIGKGYNVNYQALTKVAEHGSVDILSLMVQHFRKTSFRSHDATKLAIVALNRGHTAFVRRLLELKINVSVSAFVHARTYCNRDIVKELNLIWQKYRSNDEHNLSNRPRWRY